MSSSADATGAAPGSARGGYEQQQQQQQQQQRATTSSSSASAPAVAPVLSLATSAPNESTPILGGAYSAAGSSGLNSGTAAFHSYGVIQRPPPQQQKAPDSPGLSPTLMARRHSTAGHPLGGGRRSFVLEAPNSPSLMRRLSTTDSVTRRRRKASSSAGVSIRPPSLRDLEHNVRPPTWMNKLLEKYGAVELDNKGSTARDHLALERTFLAWLRTSLSFAGIGIAITQLFRLNSSIAESDSADHLYLLRLIQQTQRHEGLLSIDHDAISLSGDVGLSPISIQNQAHATRLRAMGKPLGASFLGVAILVLFAGWRRYAESQHYIIRGKFPASRGSIAVAAVAAASLIIATFTIVLAVDPSVFMSH